MCLYKIEAKIAGINMDEFVLKNIVYSRNVFKMQHARFMQHLEEIVLSHNM